LSYPPLFSKLFIRFRVVVAEPKSALSSACKDKERSHEACLINSLLFINTQVINASPESSSGDSHGDRHNTPGTLEATSPVNCTTAKTVLAYSDSSPRTRVCLDCRNLDSCRVGLTESKLSSCIAPDTSVCAFLHVVGTEIISVERVCCVYRATQCC
jgi:hypothetical protein